MSRNQLRIFAVLSAVLLLCGGAWAAPSPALLFAAVDGDGQMWFYQAPQAPYRLADDTLGVWHPQWNQDGHFLAFTRHQTADNTSRLLVFDVENAAVFQLVDGLTAGFPVTFMLDNTHVLYAVTGDRTDPTVPQARIDIYRSALSPDAIPEMLGSFDYGIGCGGGIENTVSWAYAQETGTTPGWGYLTLVETPYGILHSGDCGGRNNALLDLENGGDTPLPDDFNRLVVSPERTQAIGFGQDGLSVVDLASLDVLPLTILQNVADITWGADNTIFFSAPRNDAQEWGIWKLELNTRQTALLYRMPDTYLLARLTNTADYAALYFSQIVQPADADPDTPVTVNLLRLDLQTGVARKIASDVHQATVSPLAG